MILSFEDEHLLTALSTCSDFKTMSFNLVGRLSYEAFMVLSGGTSNLFTQVDMPAIKLQWFELFHLSSAALQTAATSAEPANPKHFITMEELLLKFKPNTPVGDRIRELCYAKLAKENL